MHVQCIPNILKPVLQKRYFHIQNQNRLMEYYDFHIGIFQTTVKSTQHRHKFTWRYSYWGYSLNYSIWLLEST